MYLPSIPKRFALPRQFPRGLKLALVVVVVAGLSQEIGQIVVLFLNRIKPVRFVFSLLINALLFAFGFLALVGSTWLITLAPWTEQVSFTDLVIVLGLAYAPLLFAFLGALPYLGVPILSLLSIWHLLAMVVGFGALTNLSVSQAFGYVVFGWVVLQILQNTLGRPLASLGRRIGNGLKTVLGLLAMVVLTVLVLLLLRPLREWWFSWLSGLPTLARWVLNLMWISLVIPDCGRGPAWPPSKPWAGGPGGTTTISIPPSTPGNWPNPWPTPVRHQPLRCLSRWHWHLHL
jgi:hypothetical protein